jgi:hypothetical protein
MYSATKRAKACFIMLHHNAVLSLQLQQFTFSLTEETCNPKIKRLFAWCLNEVNNILFDICYIY